MATTAASLKCLSVSNAAQIRFRSVSYPLAGDSFLLTLAFYAPNSMKKPALQAKDLASYSRTQLVFVSAGFWQQWHSYILFFSLSLSLYTYSFAFMALCTVRSHIVMTFGVFHDCHKRLLRDALYPPPSTL
jgi:hypothetical protein